VQLDLAEALAPLGDQLDEQLAELEIITLGKVQVSVQRHCTILFSRVAEQPLRVFECDFQNGKGLVLADEDEQQRRGLNEHQVMAEAAELVPDDHQQSPQCREAG